MLNLQMDSKTFLSEYWQKKPLVIRQALPDFINPLSADELAGLALEEDIESRLVLETPNLAPFWQLKRGPFDEKEFAALPKTHWTLLVQGVDRIIPEVASLLDSFDFIPQWRVDDVMISYAVEQGSVGPHYDNYDVFLFQAEGRRQWTLTTQDCTLSNYLSDVPLRIMDQFKVEETYILEPGDMLYLPPHVGHHGISLSDDCMTYSFGYRSYQAQEMWESLGDHLAEYAASQNQAPKLYVDPLWEAGHSSALIPPQAWVQARALLQQMLEDEQQFKRWFGCFVTSLDSQAEQHLPVPLTEKESATLSVFMNELLKHEGLVRDSACRFAYETASPSSGLQLFINGCVWDTEGVTPDLLQYVANHRFLAIAALRPFLAKTANQSFLYGLWQLQWVFF
jgi:50S ribosomal protein L16 3-hydroxylase